MDYPYLDKDKTLRTLGEHRIVDSMDEMFSDDKEYYEKDNFCDKGKDFIDESI